MLSYLASLSLLTASTASLDFTTDEQPSEVQSSDSPSLDIQPLDVQPSDAQAPPQPSEFLESADRSIPTDRPPRSLEGVAPHPSDTSSPSNVIPPGLTSPDVTSPGVTFSDETAPGEISRVMELADEAVFEVEQFDRHRVSLRSSLFESTFRESTFRESTLGKSTNPSDIPSDIPSEFLVSPKTPLISDAQAIVPVASTPRLVPYTLRQEIRPLPGELDEIPVFNSNSPEVVRQSGILLSTFPSSAKKFPNAHLDYAFKGRFDIFAHHIARSDTPETTPTLYLGILVKNASKRKRNIVKILQGASFLGTPDAPYIDLPKQSLNDRGTVFSGPGDRVSSVLLRGQKQTHWPSRLELEPGEYAMLMNLPIPLPTIKRQPPPPPPQRRVNPRNSKQARDLQLNLATQRKSPGKPAKPAKPRVQSVPSSNARSTLLRVDSKRDIYVASMALLAPRRADGRETIPTLSDWKALLETGKLATPRDIEPSPLESLDDKIFYGRVAGVSRGSEWTAQLTDKPRRKKLTIPAPGEAISFGIGTLQRGTFATGQIQSAPILVRYPDTAHLAHGNYGVYYNLTLPLYNDTKENRKVQVTFQTPIKTDVPAKGLSFYRNPPQSIFFRGTVRVRYTNDQGRPVVQYFHQVHRRGEQGQPLVTLNLGPKTSRLVAVDFIYPPDATPPQVLTIRSSR